MSLAGEAEHGGGEGGERMEEPRVIWRHIIPRQYWDMTLTSIRPPQPIEGDYRIEITLQGDLVEVVYRFIEEPR